MVVDAAREAMLGHLWSAQLGRAAAVLVAWLLLGLPLTATTLHRHTARS